MKLLRDFFRSRLVPRHAQHFRRARKPRAWHVTVPAPRAQA
ncbi:MAG TPA: hypothetical protein VGK80_04495 [Rhodanobacteraceae bacterium]